VFPTVISVPIVVCHGVLRQWDLGSSCSLVTVVMRVPHLLAKPDRHGGLCSSVRTRDWDGPPCCANLLHHTSGRFTCPSRQRLLCASSQNGVCSDITGLPRTADIEHEFETNELDRDMQCAPWSKRNIVLITRFALGKKKHVSVTRVLC